MRISLLVMCTVGYANKKYRDQTLGCCETWVRDTERTYFFCGNCFDPAFEQECMEKSNYHAEFIHLQDVGEDYQSASYKQWMGLGWLFQNSPSDWYGILGTDNYVFYDRLTTLLSRHSTNVPYMIGGFCQMRNVKGGNCQLLLGGTGLFLNHVAVQKMWNIYSDRTCGGRIICDEWIRECQLEGNGFGSACDLALTLRAQDFDVPLVIEKSLYVCNHKGEWPYGNSFRINPSTITVCHFMEQTDMLELNTLSGQPDTVSRLYLQQKHPYSEFLYPICEECKTAVHFSGDYSSLLATLVTGMPPESLIYSFDYEIPENYESYLQYGVDKFTTIAYANFSLCGEEEFDLFPYTDLFCITVREEKDLSSLLRYSRQVKKYIVLFGVTEIPEMGEDWDLFLRNSDLIVMKKIYTSL